MIEISNRDFNSLNFVVKSVLKDVKTLIAEAKTHSNSTFYDWSRIDCRISVFEEKFQ